LNLDLALEGFPSVAAVGPRRHERLPAHPPRLLQIAGTCFVRLGAEADIELEALEAVRS
jgi:hypothetical protein